MNDPIDKRIAEIEKELSGLRRQKLSELQTQMAALQASIGSPALPEPRKARPGRPASKGWAAEIQSSPAGPQPKPRGRKRGKHVPDEEALKKLSTVVKGAGSDGISARSAAQIAGVFYPRAIKLLNENFRKSGSGKWTRYAA